MQVGVKKWKISASFGLSVGSYLQHNPAISQMGLFGVEDHGGRWGLFSQMMEGVTS